MKGLNRILHHPLAIVAGLAIGILVGWLLPNTAGAMRAIGDAYLLLFKMCVAPILITLITVAIARITGLPHSGSVVRRIGLVFPLAMISIAAIATLLGAITGPGRHLTAEARRSLGVALNGDQSVLRMPLFSAPVAESAPPPAVDFFRTIVPSNVFSALANDAALQRSFIAVIFGATVGLLDAQKKAAIIDFFDGVFETFRTIIDRLMLVLPLALIAITAPAVGEFSGSTLVAMGRFIAVAIVLMLGLTVASVAIVAAVSHRSLGATYAALRRTLIFAFATQNSFASLPSAIESLQRLGFSSEVADLVAPLAITTCRIGSIAYIAISAVFVAQLYGVALGPAELALVAVGSVFAGLATAGTTGIIQLGLIGTVLALVRVPFDTALVLFVSIDVLANPLRTLATVGGGLAVATLIEGRIHADDPATGALLAT